MDQNVTNATTLLGTFLNLKRLRRRKAFMKIKPKKVKNETIKTFYFLSKMKNQLNKLLTLIGQTFGKNSKIQGSHQCQKKPSTL